MSIPNMPAVTPAGIAREAGDFVQWELERAGHAKAARIAGETTTAIVAKLQQSQPATGARARRRFVATFGTEGVTMTIEEGATPEQIEAAITFAQERLARAREAARG